MRAAPAASALLMVVCGKVIGGTIFLTYFWTALMIRRLSGGNRSEMPTTTPS